MATPFLRFSYFNTDIAKRKEGHIILLLDEYGQSGLRFHKRFAPGGRPQFALYKSGFAAVHRQ